jgi:hypothetical protein
MGIFSKVKTAMSGSGIKVTVQAPETFNAGQLIPVNVQITSSSNSVQTIKAISVKIEAMERPGMLGIDNGGFSAGSANDPRQNLMARTIGYTDMREAFTVNPGETKALTVQVGVEAQDVPNNIGNKARINAMATVEGHLVGPNASQQVQVLPATTGFPGSA